MLNISLCALIVSVISIGLIVVAFYQIFKQKKAGENDLEVIQRQLRSFALLIVSNLVMVGGMMLCGGSLIPQLENLIR